MTAGNARGAATFLAVRFASTRQLQQTKRGIGMSDFNVKITVRSSRVMDAIEDKFGSQSEMSRKTGLGLTRINGYATMRHSPIGYSGWTQNAYDFASALGKNPSDLWPQHMQGVILKRATAELSLDMEDVQSIISGESPYLKDVLGRSVKGMKPRYITAAVMASEGRTLDDIGSELGVSRERARQIAASAFRRMRVNLLRIGIREFGDAV